MQPVDAPTHAQNLRLRLLERVADDDTPAHLTVLEATAPGPAWRLCLPGVWRRVLHQQDGLRSYLLRLEPGAELPGHRHPADEECVVLEGELWVGRDLRLGAGSWHLARAGALHARIRSPLGALIYLRGPVPEPGHRLG